MAQIKDLRQSDKPDSWEFMLDSNERLLWKGEPAKGLRFNGAKIVKSLFGIPLLLFGLFFANSRMDDVSSLNSLTRGLETSFLLIGSLFILVGLNMIVGQYFWNAYKRKRTRYALSDRRAFIVSKTFIQRLKTHPIRQSTKVDMKAGPETSIYFSDPLSTGNKKTHRNPIAFEYISEGEEVYRLIRQIQNEGRDEH